MRPYGQSLSDFCNPHTASGLLHAEKTLLAAVARGKECYLDDHKTLDGRHVNQHDDKVRVRASFLRFLALGGDEHAPIHEEGVRLRGAFVAGDLDLTDGNIDHPLVFHNCKMGHIILSHTRLRRVDIAGIEAVRATVEGSVYITGGYLPGGDLSFSGSVIHGDFNCAADSVARLYCADATIHGNVYLTDKFTASDEVVFSGSDIHADFNCTGGSFDKLY